MSFLTLLGKPVVEDQPSGLRRVTRFWTVSPEGMRLARIEDEAFIAYGTPDAEFTTALLVDQRIERRTEQGVVLTLVRVYQELADSALTATTEVVETTAFDGRRVTRTTYLCKSSQAATLRPAIGSGDPAIFQVDIETKGPVSVVVTSAIEITDAGFILSQDDQTRNNGALLLRTIRTVGAAPATPVGYTVVSASTQNVDGYTVYSSTFAKGDGQISQDDDTKNGGKLLLRTIRHLVAPAAANPIVTPTGYTLVSAGSQEADGHRVWTALYAKGAGRISTDVSHRQNGKLRVTTIRYLETDDGAAVSGELIRDESQEQDGYTVFTKGYSEIIGDGLVVDSVDTKNGGKLVLYHKVRLGSAPVAPVATIAGTVVLTSSGTREEDGYTVYDYRWAEGVGEIGRDVDYAQSSDQGTTGITRTTIRYLTAVSVTVDPTTLAGSVKIGERTSDQDGHRVWTVTYAKGAGTVVDESDIRIVGRLVTYHRVALGAEPTAPLATISGTVTQAASSVRKEAGFDVYDYRWVEANGQSTIETLGQPDGALDYVVTTMSAAAETPSYPGSGTAYLIRLDQDRRDGFFTNRAVYRKPPATVTLRRQVRWPKPGSVSITSPNADIILVSGAVLELLASIEVSYGTAQDTTDPFKVENWASLNESYTIAESGQVVVRQEVLHGHLSSALSGTGTASSYHGVTCSAWSYSISSSTPNSLPSNPITIEVDNVPYLTATDGTVVYRKSVTTISL